MKMYTAHAARKGFSLLEITLVVLIMGVLMTVAVVGAMGLGLGAAYFLLTAQAARLLLRRDHRDRGERRAQFVRRGRGEPAQGRQRLFAREHGLNRGERDIEALFFRRDPPGIDAGEAQADEHCGGDAEFVKLRDVERRLARPGQGQPPGSSQAAYSSGTICRQAIGARNAGLSIISA